MCLKNIRVLESSESEYTNVGGGLISKDSSKDDDKTKKLEKTILVSKNN